MRSCAGRVQVLARIPSSYPAIALIARSGGRSSRELHQVAMPTPVGVVSITRRDHAQDASSMLIWPQRSDLYLPYGAFTDSACVVSEQLYVLLDRRRRAPCTTRSNAWFDAHGPTDSTHWTVGLRKKDSYENQHNHSNSAFARFSYCLPRPRQAETARTSPGRTPSRGQRPLQRSS